MSKHEDPAVDDADGMDLVDDAFDIDSVSDLSRQPVRKFKSWHLPRKQYVRIKQWCHELDWLLKKSIERRNDKVVRLLTLPGEDFLDVRQFHSHCDRKEVGLCYVGFLSGESRVATISKAETQELRRIDGERSHLYGSQFEDVRHKGGNVYKSLQTRGPFDLVNLDLCRALGAKGGAESLAAMEALLQLQRDVGASRWSLLLTWRVDGGAFKGAQTNVVADALQKNLDHRAFRERWSTTHFGNSHGTLEANWPQLGEGHRVRVAGLAVGKWLLARGLVLGWKVSVSTCYCYTVAIRPFDMASVVYRFEPVQIEESRQSDAYEVDCAVELHDQVREMADLDAKLAEDTTTYERMFIGSKQLLLAARYDLEAYDAWVQKARRRIDEVRAQGAWLG